MWCFYTGRSTHDNPFRIVSSGDSGRGVRVHCRYNDSQDRKMGIGHSPIVGGKGGDRKKKPLAFVGGSDFWNMLLAYRIVWIHGRYGAGKTSLAVMIAARLMAEGYIDQCWSNMPMTFSSKPGSGSYDHVGIVLDEAWLYLETRRDVRDYAAFVRKFEHYLILPGIFPIHARLNFLRVQRIFNGYVVGFPAWFYRWRLKYADIKETGTFFIMNPTSIFGHYPTKFVPGDDGGISDEIVAVSKRQGFMGTRSEQYKDQDPDNKPNGSGFSMDETIANLDDVAFEFDETIQGIEEAITKAKKFRK